MTYSQDSHSPPITDLRQEQRKEVDNFSEIVATDKEMPPGGEEQEIEKSDTDHFLPDSQPRLFQEPSRHNRQITDIGPVPNIVKIGEEVESAASGEEILSEIDDDDRSTKTRRNNRSRLLNPGTYFKEIEDLEEKSYHNSALYLWGPACVMQDGRTLEGSRLDLMIPVPEYAKESDSNANQTHRTREFEQYVISACKNVSSSADDESSASYKKIWHAFHLLECHNLMFRVWENVEDLVRDGFCAGQLSVLMMDETRSNIVHLVAINVEAIKAVWQAFETAILSSRIFDNDLFLDGAANQGLLDSCLSFLDSVGWSQFQYPSF